MCLNIQNRMETELVYNYNYYAHDDGIYINVKGN